MTDDARPNNLVWNGVEWVDQRCGCRYHPDDDNDTHGGGPHIHPCERHRDAERAQRERLEVALRGIKDSVQNDGFAPVDPWVLIAAIDEALGPQGQEA